MAEWLFLTLAEGPERQTGFFSSTELMMKERGSGGGEGGEGETKKEGNRIHQTEETLKCSQTNS